MNEKSIFDLANVVVKVTNILPSETIVDAIGQTLCIIKALAFEDTLATKIIFYHFWQRNLKTIKPTLLTDLQLQFQKIRRQQNTQ